MSLRNWLKHALPYPLTCAIARAIAVPFLAQEQRCERLWEYSWVLHHVKGPRIMDFGYAGSHLAEALCQFGAVVGVDPRETPAINQIRFQSVRSLTDTIGAFDTIVCISVLEHYLSLEVIIPQLYGRLVPGGQMLLTYPTWIDRPQQFRGYQELRPIWSWSQLTPGAAVATEVWLRTSQGWMAYSPEAMRIYEGPNTEHRTTTLACTRIVRPVAPPMPDAPYSLLHGSAFPALVGELGGTVGTMGLGSPARSSAP